MAVNVQQSIFSEIAEFIVSQPSLDEIANYHVPAHIQQRIDYLLDKNNENRLSSEERMEIEKLLAAVDIMDIAKLKAMLKLAGKA
jgi:hypothetical protein